MPYCDCNTPAALASIANTCIFDTSDIQRAGIRRTGNGAAADVATFKTAAYWTPLLSAVNSTKVIFTPNMWETDFPQGEISTEPGYDGTEEAYGSNAIVITGHYRGISGAAWTALNALSCEPSLEIMFVTTSGNLVADNNGDAPTFFGIKGKYSIGAMGKGQNSSYRTPFRFTLPANWAKEIQVYTPTDFSALSFLVNP